MTGFSISYSAHLPKAPPSTMRRRSKATLLLGTPRLRARSSFRFKGARDVNEAPDDQNAKQRITKVFQQMFHYACTSWAGMYPLTRDIKGQRHVVVDSAYGSGELCVDVQQEARAKWPRWARRDAA
jgi:hypothetical protein